MGRGIMVVATLGVLLGACVAEVKKAEQRPMITMKSATKPEPIRFEKLLVDIRRGSKIGGFSFSMTCAPNNSELTWGGGRINASSLEAADIFFHEMANAGYEVVGDPKQLFKPADEPRATYGIGGRITEMQLGLCDAVDFFGRPKGLSGDAYLKIHWQAFDKLERKVVFETTTEGTFKNETPTFDGEVVAVHGALANAVANLAADQNFHDLLTTTAKAEPEPALAQDTLTFPAPGPQAAPIAQHMDNVRASVVTIISDGSHGSGFFISKDGHILTNQHVVGGAKMVKVRLVTGREMLGEVVRSHKTRDVALVLVEEKGYRPLPLRLTEPGKVGEDVYAIGTPLYVELSSTVSRGIVSAIRRDAKTGREDLQADVDIHGGNSGGPLLDAKGNVIGLTYAGMGMDTEKTSVGLNLFIPIADALDKLKLRPVDERTGR